MGQVLILCVEGALALRILSGKVQVLQDSCVEGLCVRWCLATKCDLEKDRMVQQEEGEALAAQQHMSFVETSSKDNVNIDRAFTKLAVELKCRHESGGSNLDDFDSGSATIGGGVFQLGGATTSLGSDWNRCCRYL